jgi:hypothetical protein
MRSIPDRVGETICAQGIAQLNNRLPPAHISQAAAILRIWSFILYAGTDNACFYHLDLG